MPQRLAAILLFVIAGTCAAQEPPPLPEPPQTSAIPAVPVESRPALPTLDDSPAQPATTQPAPAPDPRETTDAVAKRWVGPAVPVDSGVWYRPEAVLPGVNEGLHLRYPYYSYRRPWYPAGPASVNVTIIW